MFVKNEPTHTKPSKLKNDIRSERRPQRDTL